MLGLTLAIMEPPPPSSSPDPAPPTGNGEVLDELPPAAIPEAGPASPAGRGTRWAALLMIALVCGVGFGLWLIWWDPMGHRPGPYHDGGQGYEFPVRDGPLDAGQAEKHLQVLADAMRRYRDEFGDGVRWPMTLEDLKYVDLLPRDYQFRGLLSQRPLHYAPDVPAGHDPARWAICCDVKTENRRGRNGYDVIRVPVGAVVILGDGTVRVLQERDLTAVGGLQFDQGAAR